MKRLILNFIIVTSLTPLTVFSSTLTWEKLENDTRLITKLKSYCNLCFTDLKMKSVKLENSYLNLKLKGNLDFKKIDFNLIHSDRLGNLMSSKVILNGEFSLNKNNVSSDNRFSQIYGTYKIETLITNSYKQESVKRELLLRLDKQKFFNKADSFYDFAFIASEDSNGSVIEGVFVVKVITHDQFGKKRLEGVMRITSFKVFEDDVLKTPEYMGVKLDFKDMLLK